MKNLLFFLLLISSPVLATDQKISQLSLTTAAGTGVNDSIPIYNYTLGETERITLWDIPNLPSFASAFAPINNATFTGTTTVATLDGTNVVISGALNVSGTTTLATGLTGACILSSGVVSANTITGSGNSVESASPTLSGTIGGNLGWSGNQTDQAAGATQQSVLKLTGAPYPLPSPSPSASPVPMLEVEPTGVSEPSTWSNAAGGTVIGINEASTFLGNFEDYKVNGTSFFTVSDAGSITVGTWNGTIISNAKGGTGISTASSTGDPSLSSGTWSIVTVANHFISLFETVATSVGDQLVGGTSGAPTRVANGTTGQLWMATASSAETWITVPGNSTVLKAPTIQTFVNQLATFTITSGVTASIGALYEDGNSNFYTVSTTLTSGQTTFVCTATNFAGTVLGSGTLTKSSGTGSASITYSAIVKGTTYTTPTSPGPLYIRVRMVGGAGGGDDGTSGAGTGVTGLASTFGTSLLSAGAGIGATASGAAGGGSSLGSGPIGIALVGGSGTSGTESTTTSDATGGHGGGSAFGSGASGSIGSAGGGGGSAPGSGGGGGGTGGLSAGLGGGGGGAGGYVDALIASPSATYAVSVGLGGAGGTSGVSGQVGGGGTVGLIEVTEFYQ